MDAHELGSIAAALAELHPELGRTSPLRVIGEGFDSVALETPDAVIVRVARNEWAAVKHAMEERLLRAIRSRLSLPVPDVRCRIEPGPGVPFGAIAHTKLEGRELGPELPAGGDLGRIPEDLAAFFAALHRVPADEARRLGVPARDLPSLLAIRGEIGPILDGRLSWAERRTLERWWDALLADEAIRGPEPTLVHADLWFVHVLVDEARRRVVGVLDFGDALVGDRAIDFAPLLYSGREYTAAVVDEYAKAGGALGERFDDRLRRYWEIRCVEGLPYVWRHLPEEVDEDIEKLRRGPIFEPAARIW